MITKLNKSIITAALFSLMFVSSQLLGQDKEVVAKSADLLSKANTISIIISAESFHQVTVGEAKFIFTTRLLTWANGKRIQVVDQSETATGKSFYSEFIKINYDRLAVEWTKLSLSGQASPSIKCKDDTEVKKIVSNNPNAIGYISSENLDNSVKEVLRVELFFN